MPVAPTYPGVYIEEIPSGVYTVTGVSTSITAFIGYTLRGSVNDPIHIFGFADFERAFGGLDGASPLSYCVKSVLPERRHGGLRRPCCRWSERSGSHTAQCSGPCAGRHGLERGHVGQ